MASLERLYWIDAELRSKRYLTWQDVSERFGVKERTVYDDLRYLRERLDAPIEFHTRYRGYYYTRDDYRLPFLALSEQEAKTLRRTFLAALAHLTGTDVPIVQHLIAKLSPYIRRLPVQGMDALAASSGGEWFVNGNSLLTEPFALSDELLTDVRCAIDEKRRLRMVYYGAHRDEVNERVVQPYLLLNWRGELYLSAHCELRGDMRDFFLPRIRSHELLDPPNAFVLPNDWNANTYLATAFHLHRGEPPVTVKVRFSPFQARWQRERRHHPSQQMEEQPDGSLLVTLNVSGTDEVKRWLLAFGADVEVLEPEALRTQMAEEIALLHQRYHTPQNIS